MKIAESQDYVKGLIDEWAADYKHQHAKTDEDYRDEDWPLNRPSSDWLEDFFCWLQTKGIIL